MSDSPAFWGARVLMKLCLSDEGFGVAGVLVPPLLALFLRMLFVEKYLKKPAVLRLSERHDN